MNERDLVVLAMAAFMVWVCSFFLRGLWRLASGKVTNAGGTKEGWYLFGVGLLFAATFTWATVGEFGDPWAVSEVRRTRGVHQWALGTGAGSIALMGYSFMLVGIATLVINFRRRHDPPPELPDIPPASPAERQELLAEIASDELWEQDHAAVAAHMHRTTLRSMMYAEEEPWDSDGPVWDALEAELERRFATDAERREAGEAIQAEYERLVEADGVCR